MHVTAGWANNCGKQLFTIGWVPCDFGREHVGGYDKFWGPDEFMSQVYREDEELLMIARAFVEIIRCR